MPPNVILYSNTSDSGVTSNVVQVSPDGTGRKQILHMPEAFEGVGLNLAVPGEKVFGYSPSGAVNPTYGIYRSNSISTSGMVTVVPPTYSFVETVQVSYDGAWVYYVAAIGSGDACLYKVATAGGAPIVLDNSGFVYTASVDIVSGSKITYDKDYTYPDGRVESAVFVKSTDSDGPPILLTNDSTANYGCPQFSPDGTKIAFVSDKDDANMEVYVVSASGGNILQVTNAPQLPKQYTGVAFSPDGTTTAFIGFDSGVYRSAPLGAQGAPTLIVHDATAIGGIYWTNASGRAQGGATATLSRRRHRGLLP